MPSAEQIYMFCHALARDAAYQLQLPSERARLHELALSTLEFLFSNPDSRDLLAHELAEHARVAQVGRAAPDCAKLLEKEGYYVQRAAINASRSNDNFSTARFYDRLAELSAGGSQRAAALLEAAGAWERIARHAHSRRRTVMALRLARGARDPLLEGKCWSILGVVRNALGKSARALTAHQKALAIARRLGDGRGEAACLGNIAQLHYQARRLTESRAYLTRGLAIARAAKDNSNKARFLLALSQHEQGEAALELILQALQAARDCGDFRAELGCVVQQAFALEACDELEESARLCETALNGARATGSRYIECLALSCKARIATRLGDNLAGRILEEAISLARETDDERLMDRLRLAKMDLGSQSVEWSTCELIETPHGKGLCAARPLAHGEPVCRFAGPVMRFEEIPPEEIRHALLLEDGRWLVDRGVARFMNHSCDPNCRVMRDNAVKTLRAVKSGEELTLAYNIVYDGEDPGEWDERWSFECKCGAKNCRGRVDCYVTQDGKPWTPPKGRKRAGKTRRK